MDAMENSQPVARKVAGLSLTEEGSEDSLIHRKEDGVAETGAQTDPKTSESSEDLKCLESAVELVLGVKVTTVSRLYRLVLVLFVAALLYALSKFQSTF
jgi:hypothetical protein